MNWQSIAFDWNQVRAFLATAEEGTLSGAARALGQSQPTLGRQVAALEKALGVVLFERVGRSLVLTPVGHDLLEHVRAMGDAAGRISLVASGRSQGVDGTVSITASDVMSVYMLPPIVAELREVAPGIAIEIVASNEIADLQRREADIAIRHMRPEQQDLIARSLGEGSAHLYAATAYLDRMGRPATPEDIARHIFVGFEQNDRLIEGLNEVGIPLTPEIIRVKSGNGVVFWEMVRQGIGIGVMSDDVAALTPGVERVLPGLGPIRFPIWLTAHRELHTSRRVRLVFDLLYERLRAGRPS